MNKITALKVDIFDILREQQTLQIQVNALETRKVEKLKELAELESGSVPETSQPVENFAETDGDEQPLTIRPPRRPQPLKG